MGKQQSDLDKLYGAVSQQLDIGNIEQFKSKMQTKEDRKKFYDAVSKNGLDLGDYSQYEDRLGKQNAVSSRGSKNTATTSTEPLQRSQPNIVSNPFGGQTQEQFIGQENARRIKSESAKPLTLDVSKGIKTTDQRNQIEKELSLKRAQKVEGKGTDIMNSLGAGVNQAYAGVAKIPRYVFEMFGVPQNLLADAVQNAAGEDILSGIRTNGTEYDTLLGWVGGDNPLLYSPLTALDKVGDIFQGRAEEFQAKQTKYDQGVFDSIKSGNLSDAGAQIVNNIAQSAPSMLAMATTSGIGNTSGLGSLGRTFINTLPFASSKANEIRDDENIPEGIKPIYSGLYGLAEVIYDQSFGTQALLNKVLETATRSGRQVAETEAKEFAKGYLKSAFDKIKEPVTDIAKNAIEEMATTFSQNLLDKAVIDPNKDLMEGVIDAGIIGGATGGILGSVNTIIKPSVKTSINQKNQQIENLSNDLDNTEIDDNSKEVILNKISNIKQEINSELTTDQENFNRLPEAKKEEALEVSGRINTIENSLANPNISEDSRATLTEEAKVLENRLNQITELKEKAQAASNILTYYRQEDIPVPLRQRAETKVKNNIPYYEVTLDPTEVDTYRDVPVEEIFTNKQSSIAPQEMIRLNEIVREDRDNGSPLVTIENVALSEIIPTQKQVRNDNIEAAANSENNEPPVLVKKEDKYYVVDGHHRIANMIKNGQSSVDIKVINESNMVNSPQLNQPVQDAITQEQQENSPVESGQIEEVGVVENVPAPTEQRLQAIRDKRQEIYTRIRRNTTANSGINPEVLTDLIELGATYIEEGVVRFRDFAQNLRNDFGQEISDQEMRDIYRQSANQLGYNVRGFSESVQDNNNLSEETRNSVDDLNTLYQTQNYEDINNRLDQMDEAAKVAAVTRLESVTAELSPQDNIGVLAGINLIDQYNATGETAKAQSIIDSLMKSATVAAQTLRQYGEFKRSTPDGFLELIKKRLDGKEITPEQEQEIKNLFEDIKNYKTTYEQAQQTLLNNITPTNRKARREALIAVEDAQRRLDDYIDDIKDSDVYETLSSILQGNLLTLKSVIQNPVANALQAGIGGLTNLASIPIDRLLALRTGNRSRFGNFSEDNLRNQRYAIQEGIAIANRKAFRGSTSTELSKYDTSSRLKPFAAFRRLFIDSFFKSRRDARQYTFEQGLSDLLEGTTGQVANFFFRTLPYGDDPFYQLGRQNELNRIAKTKNLTGAEYDRFIIQPDSKSADIADKVGRGQTFQNDTVISRFYNQLINSANSISNRHVKGIVKLVSKVIAPFVKTPSSVALKTVDFAAPVIPFMRSMSNMNEIRKLTANGKSATQSTIDRLQSEASKDMGTAIIGSVLGGVATVLIKEGLVTGNPPEDKERKKEKDFMYATQPPNTINISGLQRLLKGEPTEYKQGDIVNSYIPLGLVGSVIGITESTMGRDIREKQRQSKFVNTEGKPFYPTEEDNYMFDYLGNFISNIPASAQFMMQQSFLQGTSELLEAMSTGDFKNLTPQFAKTFSNIGIPNQVSQAFRANNETLRDVYTQDKWETVANVLKERYGDIKDLPKKYNMWGDPIKQSPEGTNPYIYQMLDIFRTQPVLKDKLTHQVFNLYKKTSDNSVIPSSIKDFYKQGDFDVKLTDVQLARLSELVGKERKKLATKVMLRYNMNEADMKKLDKLAEKLSTAYSEGAKRGKLKFKKELKSGRKI